VTQDNEHIGQSRMVRTKLKIPKVAIFVHASHSQMVDEVTTAADISLGTSHNILSDNLNMSRVTQLSVMP
jgi:hypothetical protein